ncbi:hypothetical protein PRK78_004220 [Emydomyces testavorans]|uniref:MYB family conidiophore development protein FlbD n=1 Tax=Emydomyces testavorans TaxID=2070801 RepID=A0AAF0IJC1_9EURO|nr:hypothetical protein PRK78_004220 [Emydomyces testavorans]
MAPTQRRGPWVPEEDQELLQLVRTQGPNNWVRISQHMKYRSPKQCRERFHQNLKPSLNHDPITPEEGLVIERMVNEMGKRWAEIARRLGNRSDNAVKNWWNGSMNRKKRRLAPSREPGHPSRVFNGRTEPPCPKSPVHSPYTQGLRLDGQPSWLLANGSQTARDSIYARKHWTPANSLQQSPAPHHRHLPFFTLDSSSQIDHPLTSPCFSEISNRTSAGPPSMISDHTSVASASPKTVTSPSIASTPMEIYPGYEGRQRRRSAPTVGFIPNHNHTYGSMAEAKSMDALSEHGPFGDWHNGTASDPHLHRRRFPSYSDPKPPSAVRDRDARMGLDNLLN